MIALKMNRGFCAFLGISLACARDRWCPASVRAEL